MGACCNLLRGGSIDPPVDPRSLLLWISAVLSPMGQSPQKKKKKMFFFSMVKGHFSFFSECVDTLYRCSGSHFSRYGFSEAKVQCQKATAASIGRHGLVEVQCGRNIVPAWADSN